MLIFTVLLPVACGLALLALPLSRRRTAIYTEAVTVATSLLAVACLLLCRGRTQAALPIARGLSVAFRVDGVGCVFTALIAFLWPLAALYGFEYMEHVGGEKHFFALYTVTYGVTLGISFAANLVTLYVFYEFLTLCTMPLVMHGSSPEALRAGRQYMLYSFFGAALAFVGVMIVTACGAGGDFAMGGVLGDAFAREHPALLSAAYLCMFVGFGAKAAVFPLHAWLPTASVAPTPVTALLHAVAVVKAGAFAIVRMTYFSVGAQLLRGRWPQTVAIVLSAVTIVYGSTMAVRERHFKRRLAYSTVSNLSYIVFAASLMTQDGLVAGMAHMLFHALIKITLFLCAGAVLVRTGRTQVESMRGLASVMPKTCAAYTFGALALTGTPLLPAFVSKWLIGVAAVEAGTRPALLGLAAILVSAVLTAIYLVSVAFSMCFRPLQEEAGEAVAGTNRDPGWRMILPLGALCAAILLCGVCSGPIVSALQNCVGVVP